MRPKTRASAKSVSVTETSIHEGYKELITLTTASLGLYRVLQVCMKPRESTDLQLPLHPRRPGPMAQGRALLPPLEERIESTPNRGQLPLNPRAERPGGAGGVSPRLPSRLVAGDACFPSLDNDRTMRIPAWRIHRDFRPYLEMGNQFLIKKRYTRLPLLGSGAALLCSCTRPTTTTTSSLL